MSKVTGVEIGTSDDWDKQMEFLLGRPLDKKFKGKLGRCFHLNTQVDGVLEALKLMGLTVDDVIYEEDRKILREVAPPVSNVGGELEQDS